MKSKDSALMEMMTQLMTRMDRLEENSKCAHSRKDTTAQRSSDQEAKPRVVVVRKGTSHGAVLSLKGPPTRETRVPWGVCPDPKGNLKGIRVIKYCCVNC